MSQYLKVDSCRCQLEDCQTEFCPELSQLADTEVRDRELKLLLAVERNLPLQVAVDCGTFQETQVSINQSRTA
jgi:hypothetical protein